MSFLPFFAISLVGSAGALLTRRSARISLAIGFGALVIALLASLAITPGDSIVVGEGTIVTTQYQRLFLVLATFSGLLICLAGQQTAWQRNIPAAILASLAWTGLALALPDASTAVVAALGGGLAGVLVTLVAPVDETGVRAATREFRSVVVAGALALVAVAWVARVAAGNSSGGDPGALGLAFLAMALGLALRFGVVPFHAWAGRLSESAPETALPLLVAWAPAAFGVVALAWTAGSVVPLDVPLDEARAVVVAIAVLSLVVGGFAAWIQDDVEHVVGYSIAQDAGFIVLALAAPEAGSWEAARTWILVFALAKTALAAWALALFGSYGTRRIDELGGWARRSPALGAAFLLLVVATIGWPGSAAWTARWDIVQAAISDPFRTLVFVGALVSLAVYARLALVGLRRPIPASGGGRLPETVRRVAAVARRGSRGPERRGDVDLATGVGPTSAGVAASSAAGTPGSADPPASGARPRVRRPGPGTLTTAIAFGRRLPAEWHARRATTATAVTLALAVVALAAAAGGLGIPAAAREPAPAAPAGAAAAPGSPAPSGSLPGAADDPTPGASAGQPVSSPAPSAGAPSEAVPSSGASAPGNSTGGQPGTSAGPSTASPAPSTP